MNLREITEAVRAVNDLVQTVSTNPNAQQMAMAFLNSRQGGRNNASAAAPESTAQAAQAAQAEPSAAPAAQDNIYHEIPLRRKSSAAPEPKAEARPVDTATPPDRREIPLRRRGPANSAPRPFSRASNPVSGSGDADVDDGR
jgi:peptidoglycan hydrolase CwlO-like protein